MAFWRKFSLTHTELLTGDCRTCQTSLARLSRCWWWRDSRFRCCWASENPRTVTRRMRVRRAPGTICDFIIIYHGNLSQPWVSDKPGLTLPQFLGCLICKWLMKKTSSEQCSKPVPLYWLDLPGIPRKWNMNNPNTIYLKV